MQVKLTIGERLKDLRVERKLTLEQLAAEVGISKSTLGKYESDNGKDISPYSRWRSQPLSRVSGQQRYNTLDFASKIVCQQKCSRPYWKPSVKEDSPL